MKYTIKPGFLIYLFFVCTMANAQEKEKQQEPVPEKNNIVKINLPALAFKNISVQYERKIGKRISVAVNVHTIPFGKLPFQNTFSKLVDNSDVQYDQFKLGSFGIVPEFRFYVGKKGALRGFYFGPFLSIAHYKVNLPVNYSNNTKTGIFTGDLNTVTGGLQLGSQFKLSKHLTLDWWILGPNYGSGTGTFNFSGALTPSEQTDLSSQLEELKEDVPFNTIKSYSVNSTGASLKAQGPWAGLRGGFNLGFRF